MDNLKPCPFCGQTPDEDSHYVNQGTKWGGILCCIEGPEVRTGYKPWPHWKDAAVKEWNTRTPPPGYVLVPIEPTNEMALAIHKAATEGKPPPKGSPVVDGVRLLWQAAIAAVMETE